MFHYESASLVGIGEGLFFSSFGLHLFCMAGSFCMFFVAFFCKLEARLGNEGFICAFCFCMCFAFLFANSKRLLGRYQKPRKTYKNLDQITKTLGNVPKTCRNMFHGLRRAKLAGPAASPGQLGDLVLDSRNAATMPLISSLQVVTACCPGPNGFFILEIQARVTRKVMLALF